MSVEFFLLVFFFKQKTAYEMRISDWSSDVCSSDLEAAAPDTQSPLEPLPGLGVAWPDMDKPDAVAPLEPDEEESTTAIEEKGGDAVEAPITIDTASVDRKSVV